MDISILLIGLRQMGQVEMDRLDAASGICQNKAQSQLDRLNAEFKKAAGRAVTAAFIAPAELDPSSLDTTANKMNRYVAAAVLKAGRESAEKLQLELNADLATAVNYLHAFATTVDQVVRHVYCCLVEDASANSGDFSLVTQLEQLWVQYRSGAVTDPDTAFETGLFAAALGVPALQSGLLALPYPEVVHQTHSIESFKQSYREAVWAEIDHCWQSDWVELAASDYVNNVFAGLKRLLDYAVDKHWHALAALPTSAFAAPSPYVTPAPFSPNTATEAATGDQDSASERAALAGTAPLAGQLVITRGQNVGQSFQLGDRACLGRGENNEIRLVDRKVSRYHAQIERKGVAYWLTDLNSSNGTLLNGARLTEPKLLCSGDLITIGDLQLTFLDKLESSPSSHAPPVTSDDELTATSDQLVPAGESLLAPVCARCHQPLKSGVRFCGNCGEPVTGD